MGKASKDKENLVKKTFAVWRNLAQERSQGGCPGGRPQSKYCFVSDFLAEF